MVLGCLYYFSGTSTKAPQSFLPSTVFKLQIGKCAPTCLDLEENEIEIIQRPTFAFIHKLNFIIKYTSP